MTLLAVLPVMLAGSVQAVEAKPPPKEPEEPFKVYVFTEVPGDPDDGDSLGRTTEEVGKKIRDRKKWFRIVETREDADIVVEVLDQDREQSTGQTYIRKREGTSSGGGERTGPGAQAVGFADIRESQALLTRIFVPKGEPFEMSAQGEGRRPRDAARPFAQRLETFVRLNYWTLMEALAR